jgi:RNA polymerase-binding transcription factor DksA
MKRCKVCRAKFEPRFSTLQQTCDSPECALAFARSQQGKAFAAKAHRKALRERREAVKTMSEVTRDTQRAVNAFIRARDSLLFGHCISCGKPIQEAGHFYTVGANPGWIRYHPMNLHGQCTDCNCHRGGNTAEYMDGLIARYGLNYLERLRWLKRQYNAGSRPKLTREKMLLIKAGFKVAQQRLEATHAKQAA